MIKTVLLLTPNPDHPSHHGRWPYVLEAYQAALSGIGAEIHDAPWSQLPEGKPDLILPLIAWGYHNAPVAFRAAMMSLKAAGHKVLNAPEILGWNVDKHYLRDLAEAGIRIVPTQFVPKLTAEAVAQARVDFGERLVIKPTISAGAKLTAVWDAADVVPGGEALPDGPCLIQPFLPAIQSEGEWSLIFLGGEFSHAVLKTPKEGDFRSQPDYDAHLRLKTPPQEALELARAAIEYVGDGLLYARVDMVRDTQGRFCLMELELIEPDLYLSYAPEAQMRFKDVIEAQI